MLRPTLALAALALAIPAARAQVISVESLDLNGVANKIDDFPAAISDDGRFLVYTSRDGWFPGDVNARDDVFHRDRLTGTIRKCSVDSSGGPANGSSSYPEVSADGRFVVFTSVANNLVPGDTNMTTDVFLYDTWTQAIELVSRAYTGAFGNSWSGSGTPSSLSADGRFVAYTSRATNLVAGIVTFNQDQVYVRDRVLGVTECVSDAPGAGDVGSGSRPSMSRDGRFVCYSGLSGALQPGLPPGTHGAFVYDRTNGTSEIASVNTAGQLPNSPWVGDTRMSANGRFVVFESNATNLDPLDSESLVDWFLRDRVAGTTRVVTENLMDIANTRVATPPDDGSALLISTDSNVWTLGDMNSSHDVYRRNLTNGQMTLLSRDYRTGGATGYASANDATPDGRFATLQTLQAHLAFDPPAGDNDVYVLDLVPQNVTTAVAYCTSKTNSAGCQPAITMAGEPSAQGPGSAWITADSMMNATSGMLLWSLSPAALPFYGSTLCVGAPRHRTHLQPSGGTLPPALDCSGTYSFHFSPSYAGGLGLQAGARIHAQYYQRDPGQPPPNNLSLTRGIAFDLVP